MKINSIHHHLSDASLMAFASGSLPEHMSLVIATHLAICPACRNAVKKFEDVGGVKLEEIDRLKMSKNALSSAMSLIEDSQVFEIEAPANDIEPEARKTSIPLPLRNYVPDGLDAIKWRNMAPGIKCFPLEGVKAGNGTIRLLKIAPGVTIPEHSHTGNELTLILQGCFSDQVGRFKAGDIADLDDDIDHQPIADTSEPCICLIATEGPLKFKSLMPKLMQYFIGM